jgi:hypothetical protein
MLTRIWRPKRDDPTFKHVSSHVSCIPIITMTTHSLYGKYVVAFQYEHIAGASLILHILLTAAANESSGEAREEGKADRRMEPFVDPSLKAVLLPPMREFFVSFGSL